MRFSPEALRDLSALRTHIAKDSPKAAIRVAKSVVASCRSLSDFPLRGRPGQAPGTRELVAAYPYVIVYQVLDDVVEIVRIWHGAQDR